MMRFAFEVGTEVKRFKGLTTFCLIFWTMKIVINVFNLQIVNTPKVIWVRHLNFQEDEVCLGSFQRVRSSEVL